METLVVVLGGMETLVVVVVDGIINQGGKKDGVGIIIIIHGISMADSNRTTTTKANTILIITIQTRWDYMVITVKEVGIITIIIKTRMVGTTTIKIIIQMVGIQIITRMVGIKIKTFKIIKVVGGIIIMSINQSTPLRIMVVHGIVVVVIKLRSLLDPMDGIATTHKDNCKQDFSFCTVISQLCLFT
jgi:hypothetical protein